MDKLELKKEKFLTTIDTLKSNYHESTHMMGQNNQALSAFVTFRSMEGAERSLYAFSSSWIKRTWFKIFYCCTN